VHFYKTLEGYRYGSYAKGKEPQQFPNYFSHVRYEDMMPSAKETITGIRGIGRLKTGGGGTRKILETQSDLFQKGALERELIKRGEELGNLSEKGKEYYLLRQQELSKLQLYSSNDPLAQLRTFREEVKRAAVDGKDTLLIPSGETAMRIEGLGKTAQWFEIGADEPITIEKFKKLKIGEELEMIGGGPYGTNVLGRANRWIITNILGEGKFKAVPKDKLESLESNIEGLGKLTKKQAYDSLEMMTETFDISSKTDTQHFVYKLNEQAIPREARRIGLNVEGKISADNGEWWKINIPPERAQMPVEAYGTGAGLFPLTQKSEEEKKKLKFLNKSTYGKR